MISSDLHNSGYMLFSVADGHGKGGEHISQFAVNRFAELMKVKADIN